MQKEQIIAASRKCDHIVLESIRHQLINCAELICERNDAANTSSKADITTTITEMLMQHASHEEIATAYAIIQGEYIMHILNDAKDYIQLNSHLTGSEFKNELNNSILNLIKKNNER